MTKENHKTEIAENSEFDFFDFSDVDPFFAKRNAVANEILALISYESMTRKQLSEKLECAPSRLSKVLSGEQNLTINTITSISMALGYDFSIYFHKVHEKEMVQPWEKKLEISSMIHNHNLIAREETRVKIHIQSKDDVMNDLFNGRGKETYFSVSINSNIIEKKSIENKKNKLNTIFFNDSQALNTLNVTPKMVINHG